MIKKQIDKGIIECLLSESAGVKDYINLLDVYTPTPGAVLAKLVYYQTSKWEDVSIKKGDVILSDDVATALSEANADVAIEDTKVGYSSKDTPLPYIVIVNPGTVEGLSVGDIRQVDPKAITGEVFTDDFLSFAKSIQEDRNDNEGNPLIEAKNRNIIVRMTALEKNWGKYRVSMPWLKLDKHNMDSYLFYELHTPHLRGAVNKEILKNLLDYAEEE